MASVVSSHSGLPAAQPAVSDCPRLSGKIFLAYVGLFGLALLEHKMFLAIDDPLYTFMAWFIPVACVGVLAAHAIHFRRCIRQAIKEHRQRYWREIESTVAASSGRDRARPRAPQD